MPHDEEWCPDCESTQVVDEWFNDQIGDREVIVTRLYCGHELVWTKR